MNNRITFKRLEKILKELGFRKKIVPDSCVTYSHPPTKALLIVRLHKPDDLVPGYVIIAARLELEWKGILEPKSFEAMLQSAAA